MWTDLLGNQILWTAVLASAFAQLAKLIIYFIVDKEWEWDRLAETGGMPSSHSATVCALATGVGMEQGFGSAVFAVAAIFAFIVMYDATGVRRAAGMHAERLNDLAEQLKSIITSPQTKPPLQELLGHTYPQVIVGGILGVVFAVASFKLF